MGIEDVELDASGGSAAVTRYGLGARGVDVIERTGASGTVTTGYPVYDAHGNNVATLSRNGSGGFSLADRRSYEARGIVRSQQSGGDSKLRYCANLGHRQDDESGLVYMRARYYEPTSGRFISQDPDRAGLNLFVYAGCDPIGGVDPSGRDVQRDCIAGLIYGFITAFISNGICSGQWPTLRSLVLDGVGV